MEDDVAARSEWSNNRRARAAEWGSVAAIGIDVHPVTISIPEQSAKFYEAVSRFKIDICYCSVYDDCWTAHWLVPKVDETSACHESKDEFDY